MPNTRGAEHRISYLLFRDCPAQYHPTTISGDQDGIFSYKLPIVLRATGDRYLAKTLRNSSMTTNRHIQAAWNMLRAHGYQPSDDDTELVFRGPFAGHTLYTYWEQRP